MTQKISRFRLISFALLIGFCMGFFLFITEARRFKIKPDVHAEAIVVLTGGQNRVSSALQLLAQSPGSRLLISGVHPDSRPEDIAIAANASPELFACCVDRGLDAQDTIGNASETAAWVAKNGYNTLIIVTNDYHMPRALLELRTAMPQTQFIAYSIATQSPYSGAESSRRWLQEYVKYIAVFTRVKLGF